MQQTQKLCIRVCYFLPVKTPGAHKAATVIISMSFIVIVVCFCFQSTFARFVNLFAFSALLSLYIYTTYTLSINLSCQSQVRLFGPDSAVINLFVGQLHYQMNIILKYWLFYQQGTQYFVTGHRHIGCNLMFLSWMLLQLSEQIVVSFKYLEWSIVFDFPVTY